MCQGVCYHKVHESVAMDKSLVRYIPSRENISDLMTKVTNGQKRRYLVSNILYDIYEDSQIVEDGKIDPIHNSITHEGNRKFWLC